MNGRQHMANYEAVARSNYFAVTDPAAFEALCGRLNCQVITTQKDGRTLYGLIGPDGGWPTSVFDEVQDEDIDLDIRAEIGALLEDEWVCVLVETGHEKARYCIGVAHAFNNRDEEVTLDIGQITELAKPLGSQITEPEY